MELEYIFRIGILLVVVIVVIGMILTFKDQISNMIKNIICQMTNTCTNGGLKFPIIEEKTSGTFTSAEIATHIQSCYSTISSLSPSDIPAGLTNCYILKGNFNVNSQSIIQSITNPDLRNKVTITSDFTGAVIIQYKDPDGIILVK